MGICFCASLYAAAVRKPRECSAAASPGARRVERSACTFGRWRVAGAVVVLIVMGGCRSRAVRLAGERARGCGMLGTTAACIWMGHRSG